MRDSEGGDREVPSIAGSVGLRDADIPSPSHAALLLYLQASVLRNPGPR